jgi:SH3 domain-containing YSC84-like protein 1
MKLGKIHNPLPQSLQQDLIKCTHIIKKFTKNELSKNESLSKVIPPGIIRNAKGICIMTVVKAGFLFSGRAGTGLVVARTANGWSAPSAIGTAGMG